MNIRLAALCSSVHITRANRRATMRYGVATLMMGLSLSPTSALATTRWVAAWGANNQTSFRAPPCASVQHAVVIADAGDTVFVGKGVFVEPFGVTIDKNLTVEGADSLLTRVDGETTDFSVFQI